MYIAIKISDKFLSVDDKNIVVYTGSPDYGWKYDNSTHIMTYYDQYVVYDGYFKLQDTIKASKCYFDLQEKYVLVVYNGETYYVENKGILPSLTREYHGNCTCEYIEYKTELGICHWSSLYKFNGEDVLIKGANKAKELNCKHIKLYIGRKSNNCYNLSLDNKNADLLELVKHPSYHYAISNFQTIVFVAFSTFHSDDKYWRYNFTEEDKKMEYNEIAKFCTYLLKTYPGKQFIIQNWESDWCISDDKGNDYSVNMIKWLNVRGKAVRDYGSDRYIKSIMYAVEVNQVRQHFYGKFTALTRLLPYVQTDYISYSAYDSQLKEGTTGFEECINLIKQYCHNVYIGEFGVDQLGCSKEVVKYLIDNIIKVASRTKCDYVFIWQMYNNEKGKMFGLYDNTDNLTTAGKLYSDKIINV